MTGPTGLETPQGSIDSAPVQEHKFKAMGTEVHITVVGGNQAHISMVEEIVRDRESRWSRFKPDSELMRLNSKPGVPVMVSADTFELIDAAVDASFLTGGAFDPTVLPSLIAAGYNRTFSELGGQPEVEDVAPKGVSGIGLIPTTNMVALPVGVGLDLGGIAKGATADFAVHEVLRWGAKGCCVNIGGDLHASGRSPATGGWIVEIDCSRNRPSRWVALQEGAVCTSTVDKRRWKTGRRTQHHIRDTSSGAPLETGVASISVIAQTATQAEVLTKAAMAAGVQGAERVVVGHGATGLLVRDDGQVIEFAGFDRFELESWDQPTRQAS